MAQSFAESSDRHAAPPGQADHTRLREVATRARLGAMEPRPNSGVTRVIAYVAAVLFVATAVYHCVGAFTPIDDAPPLRHALFAAINAVCACGVVRRPRWFVVAFVVLTGQQLWSHGGRFIAALPTVSALDLGVALAMLATCTWLVWLTLRERRVT